MLLLPLLLCLVPMVLGIVVFSGLRLFQEKMALMLSGAVSGLALFITITYVVTLVLPLHVFTLAALVTVALAAIVIAIATTPAWTHFVSLPTDWVVVGIVVAALGLFSIIAPKLLIQQEDGLYTGIINAYGDIAWHMANITSFAEGQSLPPQNPIFADTRLTYPFLSNFFSAMLLVGTATYTQSVALPSMFLIPILLGLVYVLTRDIADTAQFSPAARRWAGIIAVLLFLFGGATFGFLRFYGDWQASGLGLPAFMTHLPSQDYTGTGADSNGFHFLNPITALLLPQRSFLFGLPLALVIVLLLRQRTSVARACIAAGVLAGLLPLFHAHTVIALLPVIVVLFLQQPRLPWFLFALTAGVVGIPEVAYYFGNTAESGSFLRFDPGWTADQQNLIWFWLKNTGVLIPLALVGLLLPVGRPVRLLASAAFTIFLVSNLWLFAPWSWDNFKLLIFWFLFVLPLVSYVVVYIWQRWPYLPMRALIILGLLLQITAGALDIWKVALPTAATWNEWDTAGIALAEEIKKVTTPGENVLTAPIHNTPVVLAGRPLYLGFAAHVWSHGGLPWDREKAIAQYYNDQLDTLPETTIQYVLVGPAERAQYPSLVIRPTWRLVAETPGYQLYAL